jgi:hypothetical protein
LELDGFRDHAAVNHGLINSKWRDTFGDVPELTAIINAADSPWAAIPEGLTAAPVLADPGAPAANNLSFDAAEELRQQRAECLHHRDFGSHHHLQLRSYHTRHNFTSNLAIGVPFAVADGVVIFDRFVLGSGA